MHAVNSKNIFLGLCCVIRKNDGWVWAGTFVAMEKDGKGYLMPSNEKADKEICALQFEIQGQGHNRYLTFNMPGYTIADIF